MEDNPRVVVTLDELGIHDFRFNDAGALMKYVKVKSPQYLKDRIV